MHEHVEFILGDSFHSNGYYVSLVYEFAGTDVNCFLRLNAAPRCQSSLLSYGYREFFPRGYKVVL